jgi:hypothetical protein
MRLLPKVMIPVPRLCQQNRVGCTLARWFYGEDGLAFFGHCSADGDKNIFDCKYYGEMNEEEERTVC